MKTTLLIPDLLRPPAPLAEVTDAMPPLPAMRRLLGRADRVLVPGHDLDDTLCWLAGIESVPAGALTALAGGEDPGDDWCLRVDPVHLVPDADGLRLVRGAALAVTDDEAAALTVYLSMQLELPLRAAEPGHWFMRRPALDATLPAPHRALGRLIEPYLPDGPDGKAVRAWLNEIQMLLHAHPVNLRRADRDEPALNSVWPWGGGTLGPAGEWKYAWTYSDEPVLAGLAQRHGAQATAVPRGIEQLTESGPSLVRIDTVHEASRLGDVERWCDALAGLERDWFAPAARMLRAGDLRELTVLDAAGAAYTVRPAMRWRVWRKGAGFEAD